MFRDMEWPDYDETYSPVVPFTSIRALLAFAVKNDLMVHQMNVVTAFLNGTLEEEIYTWSNQKVM
jgi:hypothetical protein